MLQLYSSGAGSQPSVTALAPGKISPTGVERLCSSRGQPGPARARLLRALLHSAPVEESHHNKLIQVYWEGGTQEGVRLCQGREKGSPKLNRYRAYLGLPKGGAFQGGDFQDVGW